MRRHTCFAIVATAVGLIGPIASGSVRTCVTSTSTGFPITTEYASVGANPLYKGHTGVVDNPLYEGLYAQTSGGTVITLTGSNYACVGMPAVSGNGEVFAQIVDKSSGAASIVAFSPNGASRTISTAATGDKSGAPSCTGAGAVVFKSISQGHPVLLTAAPGSAITGTLPGLPFDSIRSVACSPRGDLIVDATPSGTNAVAAAYLGSVGGGIVGTLPDTGNLSLPGVSDACYGLKVTNSTTKLADFVVWTRDTATPGTPYAVKERRTYTGGRFALDLSMAIDPNAGSDLFALCDSQAITLHGVHEPASGQSAGLASAVAPFPSLVSVGDSLGGGTVTSLALSSQAFTSTGELMFWASIVDSGGATSNGLFAVSVPEPTTVVALASAGLMGVRRRRDHSRA